MGLFDFFKKASGDSPAQEHYTKAKEQFDGGNYVEALGSLSWGFQKDADYRPLYTLSALCLENLGATAEKELFSFSDGDFKNPAAFQKLADFYFNASLYGMARAFLEKVLALDPRNHYARHDLAICHARQFNMKKAVEELEKIKPLDLWSAYFLFKCRLLDQNTRGVSDGLRELDHTINSLPEEEGAEQMKLKMTELNELFERYQTVQAPEQHIRDWQYIQYGSVVLDFFDTGSDYVAGGRYVALWGSHETLKAVALKLNSFLKAANVKIERVAALPDRDSGIIGRVLAKELNIPFSTYQPGTPVNDVLIVGANGSSFDDYGELTAIGNNQLLFALNHNWLEPSVVCPDIIGFLSQTYYFPWNGGGFRVIDISNNLEKTEPDERSEEEIAEDIYRSKPEENDPADFRFYLERRAYLKGIGERGGRHRYNFMIESPVPGSYFG